MKTRPSFVSLGALMLSHKAHDKCAFIMYTYHVHSLCCHLSGKKLVHIFFISLNILNYYV